MPVRVTLSVDEIIATINHSSLPTAVVEGDDDVIVFRQLERAHSEFGLSILPVGGRAAVLGAYARRSELLPKKKVAFIADQDLWILSGIPEEYQTDNLLFTAGYSIENDVLQDGKLENMMSDAERAEFTIELMIVIDCFALAASRCLAGEAGDLSLHPNAMLDDNDKRKQVLTLRPGETYPDELRSRICSDYRNVLRGKSLFGLLMRRLSYPGRAVRHNQQALMEMVAMQGGPRLRSLFDKVGLAIVDSA